MTKKKTGGVLYALFLLIYAALVLAVGFFLLSKLWTYAEEYEASRPNKTMDAYVAELNERLWSQGIADQIASMEHDVQSDEDCMEAVKALLDGGITYTRTAGNGDGSALFYALRNGNGTLGKVKLVEDTSDAKNNQFGLYPWKVAEEEFDFNGLYTSVEVTVPRVYTVTLNGVTLGEEYIVEDDIHYAMLEDYYGDYAGLPTKVTYRVDHIIGKLDPVIYDAEGNQVELSDSLGDEQFISNCSEAETERLTDFVNRFAYRYARYTSGLGDNAAASYNNNLAAYIAPNSDLAARMIAAQDGLYWARVSSVEVTDLTINGLYSFGGGTYMCDYSCAVEVSRANGTDTNISNAQIIVTDTDGDMRVVEYNKY